MNKESIKSLEFHIKSNDYFGTLATVLSLLRQSLEQGKFKKDAIKILTDVEKDLLFLQKNYKINKNKNKSYMKKRSLQSKSTSDTLTKESNNIKKMVESATGEDRERFSKVTGEIAKNLREIK